MKYTNSLRKILSAAEGKLPSKQATGPRSTSNFWKLVLSSRAGRNAISKKKEAPKACDSKMFTTRVEERRCALKTQNWVRTPKKGFHFRVHVTTRLPVPTPLTEPRRPTSPCRHLDVELGEPVLILSRNRAHRNVLSCFLRFSASLSFPRNV